MYRTGERRTVAATTATPASRRQSAGGIGHRISITGRVRATTLAITSAIKTTTGAYISNSIRSPNGRTSVDAGQVHEECEANDNQERRGDRQVERTAESSVRGGTAACPVESGRSGPLRSRQR